MSAERVPLAIPSAKTWRRVIPDYLVALGAVLGAAALQIAASGGGEVRSQFLPFIAAVAVSAWVGGFGPAMTAAVLGGLVADMLGPAGTRFRADRAHLTELGLFGIASLCCIFTCLALDRARERALRALADSRADRAISDDEIARRRLAETQLSVREIDLRRHQAWLLLALRAARMGTWARGAAHEPMEYSANLEQIFGLPHNEQGGRHPEEFLECVVAEDRDRLDDAVQRAQATGAEYEVEYRVRLPDGALRWLIERGHGRPGSDSRARMFGVTMDITERKQIEEHARDMRAALMEFQSTETSRLEEERDRIRAELAHQDRLATVGQLAASIAHDLRNPLGVIRNASYLQRRRIGKPDTRVDLLDMIDAEVKTANTIITNLMELARGEAPAKAHIDLGPLVNETAQRIDSSGRVEWHFEADTAPFRLWCDVNQFRQVLRNLLGNAVEAMQGQGRVFVTARRHVDADCLRIRDTGPGVSAEVREKLFRSMVTTKQSGTGLGLMLCRQIVQRHGGTIRFIPEAEAGGAEFEVCLPHAEESA